MRRQLGNNYPKTIRRHSRDTGQPVT